jgi:hypothetical protein
MTGVPNQCLHIMVDGAHCGSPAMRCHRFCYHHKPPARTNPRAQRRPRTQQPQLSVRATPSRGRELHTGLAQVMRLLAAGQIDRKRANLMLYALQIATTNLRNTTLENLS